MGRNAQLGASGDVVTSAEVAAFEQEFLRLEFLQKRKKDKLRIVEAPKVSAPIADTHAHLDMLQNPAVHLARCAYYGISFICAMVNPVENPDLTYRNLEAWKHEAAELLAQNGLEDVADAIPQVRIAIGCHPHNAQDFDASAQQTLKRALENPLTCAIGEVGLDYHYDLSPRDVQKDVFRTQIRLAHEYDLPLILHLRDAHDEAYDIMQEEGFPKRGTLLHCCTVGEEVLRPWLKQGCYVAFGGALTFKSSEDIRHAATCVPLDRLLTETDSPYMTPEPMRGMPCGPEHTLFVADALTRLLSEHTPASQKDIAQVLYRNAQALLDW